METPGLGETVQMASVLSNFVGELLKLGVDGASLAFRGVGGISRGAYALLTLAIREHEKNLKDPTQFRQGDYGMTKMIQMCSTKNIKPLIMRIKNDPETIEQFEKYAKQGKLAYSIIPDLNTQDEYIEIMYPETQAVQYQNFMNKVNKQHAFSITFDDYLGNATPDKEYEMKQIIDSLTAEEKDIIKSAEDKAVITGDKDVPDADITGGIEALQRIPKTEVERETYRQYVIKLPNTKDKYVAIEKANCTDSGDIIEFKINPGERYQVFDKNMNFTGEITGDMLYEQHFKDLSAINVNTTSDKKFSADTSDVVIEIDPDMVKERIGESKVDIYTSSGVVGIDKSCLINISKDDTQKLFLKIKKTDTFSTQDGVLSSREFANIVRKDRAKLTAVHNKDKIRNQRVATSKDRGSR